MTDDRRPAGDLVVKLTTELAEACAERDRLAGVIERARGRLAEIDLVGLDDARILLGLRFKVTRDVVSRALTAVEIAVRILGEVDPPSYRCPKCGAVSHNPHDADHRYCGACHGFERAEPR